MFGFFYEYDQESKKYRGKKREEMEEILKGGGIRISKLIFTAELYPICRRLRPSRPRPLSYTLFLPDWDPWVISSMFQAETPELYPLCSRLRPLSYILYVPGWDPWVISSMFQAETPELYPLCSRLMPWRPRPLSYILFVPGRDPWVISSMFQAKALKAETPVSSRLRPLSYILFDPGWGPAGRDPCERGRQPRRPLRDHHRQDQGIFWTSACLWFL